MRLPVLGCSGGFPTAGQPCSGYLLEASGTRAGCTRLLLTHLRPNADPAKARERAAQHFQGTVALEAGLVTGLALTTVRVAIDDWLAHDDDLSLPGAVDQALRRAPRRVGSPGRLPGLSRPPAPSPGWRTGTTMTDPDLRRLLQPAR